MKNWNGGNIRKNSKLFGKDLETVGAMIVLIKGRMAVVGNALGKDTFFGLLLPGDLFGELFFPYDLIHADYLALAKCQVAVVPGQMVVENEGLAEAKRECMERFVRDASLLLQLGKFPAKERVRKFIERFPRANEIKLNQSHIAFACGLSPETVSRIPLGVKRV